MRVNFDRKLYTEEAIRKAYSEFFNTELQTLKKTGKEYILEFTKKLNDEELHHFESMVLLYTIEEKRK